jgi:DNA-binding NarL/FixJ family response regulator
VTSVVIIDDHEALREGLATLLDQHGIEVLGTCGNAAAALDLVAVTNPQVAIVDVRLPDESGIELAAELLERRPGLGVILYTGDTEAELLYEGLDSGARGYALKAGSIGELTGAVQTVADGGSYVDPRLDRVLLSPRATERVPQLSPREREIMALMAEGLTGEAVAVKLGLSVETIRTHVRNAVRKLRARNRVNAIAIALERGEIALGQQDPDA